MTISQCLLIFLVALASFLPSVQGLAFVASSLRTQTQGGPFAALAMRPLQQEEQISEECSESRRIGEEGISVQEMRSEMVDIVYQRSLERLNYFHDDQ